MWEMPQMHTHTMHPYAKQAHVDLITVWGFSFVDDHLKHADLRLKDSSVALHFLYTDNSKKKTCYKQNFYK